MGTYQSQIKQQTIPFILYNKTTHKIPNQSLVSKLKYIQIPKKYYGQYLSDQKISQQTQQQMVFISSKVKYNKQKILNTHIYPYSCVGLLIMKIGLQTFNATGTLISQNLVLTCASNVYNKAKLKQMQDIKFIVGIKGQNALGIYSAKKVYYPQQYSKTQDSKKRSLYNFALIKLKQKVGDKHGFLEMEVDYKDMIEKIEILGYPQQKNVINQRNLWMMQGNCQITEDKKIKYQNIQSSKGEEGSPIIIKVENKYKIIGIHSRGHQVWNEGLLLTNLIKNKINKWIFVKSKKLNIKQIIKKNPIPQIIKFVQEKIVDINDLDISNNNIGDKGLKILVKNNWSKLYTFDLTSNNITPQGIKYLISIQWPCLTKLILRNNNIGSKGVQNMIEAKWPKLAQVDLSFNKIGTQGTKYFADWKWQNLKILHLWNNNINDEAKLNFEKCQWPNLSHLVLNGNTISEQSRIYLKKVFIKANIQM